MEMLKNLLLIAAVILLHGSSYAQYFYKADLTVIQPIQINIDDYKMIRLPEDKSRDENVNRFDRHNVYTYLQIFKSSSATYFLLFQTDFFGKILFMASNNALSNALSRQQKPVNIFESCLKKINGQFMSMRNQDAAINCILERLNQ